MGGSLFHGPGLPQSEQETEKAYGHRKLLETLGGPQAAENGMTQGVN